jgi:predicted transcriptional regulator
MAIVCELLDRGPQTMQELMARVERSEAAVSCAIRRLHALRMVEYVGYAARKPGKTHIPARLVGVGPRVRLWATMNVRPLLAVE